MSVDCGPTVYTIPDACNQQFVVGRCNAKLHFLSADLAVVCDGAGQLYIVSTGNRQENGTDAWKVNYRMCRTCVEKFCRNLL
jgi:hypothetical protein